MHLLDQNAQGRQRVLSGRYRFIILVQTISFPSPEAFDRMASVILLREVIAALEVASDDCSSYLDPDTGEILQKTNLGEMLPNGSARCCQRFVPYWKAIVSWSCRTALTFMSGRLWRDSRGLRTTSESA